MRILVTGATGFLGRTVVDLLATAGHFVYALGRVGAAPTGLAGAECIAGDLAEPLRLAALPQRVDVIVHLAQSHRYAEFPDGAEDMYAINVRATFELLEWGRRVGAEHFVHASSGSVYASANRPLGEDAPLAPIDFYGVTKLAGESLARSYSTEMTTTVLRPFFIYGPGQRDKLMPRLVDSVLEGREIVLAGERGLAINPIHVTDAARAVVAVVRGRREGVFNVAGAETTSIRELAEGIGEIAGRAARLRVSEDGALNPCLVGDASAMRDVLQVDCSVRLRRGLKEVVAVRQAESARPVRDRGDRQRSAGTSYDHDEDFTEARYLETP